MLLFGTDIETTGLDQAGEHRIVEIALIIYDSATQLERGRYVQRINPQRSIDAKAQAVHGISFDELAACPTWDAIGPIAGRLLSRAGAVVAHNAGFDIPFINGELARIGQPVCTAPVIDTMLDGRWATPLGKYPNLGELCFACGIDYDRDQAHAADYDVLVMMQSLFVAMNKGFFALPVTQTELESA